MVVLDVGNVCVVVDFCVSGSLFTTTGMLIVILFPPIVCVVKNVSRGASTLDVRLSSIAFDECMDVLSTEFRS